MKIIKFLINCIISFLLILIIATILFQFILRNKILNKNYMYNKMLELKYYEQISNEINDSFDNYKYQSGLPEETLNNLFDEETIKTDVSSVIEYIYEGTEIKDSSEIVKNNLDKKINEYIENKNITLNSQGKENIEKYEDIISEEYKSNINSSNTFYKTIRDIVIKLKEVSNILGYYPYIIFAIFIILLALLNKKNLLDAIKFLGISFFSLGILFEIAIFFINKNIKIDNIMLFSISQTNLVINIFKEILINIQENGRLFIFCGIVAILVANTLNYPTTSKYRNKH